MRTRPTGYQPTGSLEDVIRGPSHAGVALLGDPRLRDLVADELAHNAASPENQDAVAQLGELLIVAAGADHGATADRHAADELEDLLARAHVDALRRLVEEQEVGIGLQPLRHQDLLLVAAGQRGVQRAGVGRADVELLEQRHGVAAHGAAPQEHPAQ